MISSISSISSELTTVYVVDKGVHTLQILENTSPLGHSLASKNLWKKDREKGENVKDRRRYNRKENWKVKRLKKSMQKVKIKAKIMFEV
jgi:hypothetical protein